MVSQPETDGDPDAVGLPVGDADIVHVAEDECVVDRVAVATMVRVGVEWSLGETVLGAVAEMLTLTAAVREGVACGDAESLPNGDRECEGVALCDALASDERECDTLASGEREYDGAALCVALASDEREVVGVVESVALASGEREGE